MNAFKLPVKDFLKRAASAEPTPGGGSVAALAGALGASMVSMVAGLTIGRERFREVEKQAVGLRDRAEVLMVEFAELADADVRAFSGLMEAFRLPRATAAERARRTGAIRAAARTATDVPLAVAGKALRALGLARSIAVIGNENAASDAGIAAVMAEAAVTAALLNVDINLPLVGDGEYRRDCTAAAKSMRTEAATLKAEVLEAVRNKMG